jgi:hypothetical protein
MKFVFGIWLEEYVMSIAEDLEDLPDQWGKTAGFLALRSEE